MTALWTECPGQDNTGVGLSKLSRRFSPAAGGVVLFVQECPSGPWPANLSIAGWQGSSGSAGSHGWVNAGMFPHIYMCSASDFGGCCSEPIALQPYNLQRIGSGMESGSPTNNPAARPHEQGSDPTQRSLAEVLDQCSVEVLQAVLLVLRSRATAARPAHAQPGQEQSRPNLSQG